MKKVRIHDKNFQCLLEAARIDAQISRMAGEINRDLAGDNPVFLCVLNGAFMFASDLMKQITLNESEIAFVRIASYAGTTSTGRVDELIGLTAEVAGRTVVIVEDIVDTGRSLRHLQEMLRKAAPKQVKTAALFWKPDALEEAVVVDYKGISLENRFVVGRGLDYDGLGRHLPDLYVLEE